MLSGKRWIILAICILLIVSLTGCKAKAPENEGNVDLAINTEAPVETTPKELSVTELLKTVTSLKDDLETALDDIKDNNLDTAKNKIESVPEKTQMLRSSITVTLTNLGDSTPSLQKELVNIQGVLDLADQLAEKILMPAIEMMEKNLVSDQQGEGALTKQLSAYLDFAETLLPEVEDLLKTAEGVDLSLVDSDGDLREYLQAAEDLLKEYHENPEILSAVKAIFGGGEDRVYLVAAQNSAEIRASGGFPGAMGVIRIQNGKLVMQDFKKVYDVILDYTPAEAKVTATENRLFHGGLVFPRDADFCPDYERVAYIWALGYTARQQEAVDGVISVTPAVLQKLLATMDEEIKLFDGTKINGKNAVRVLQHDLYFDYFGAQYVQNSAVVLDQLFSDAAKKTMEKIMENLDIGNLAKYFAVAKECIEDRTLMLWMTDESEQAVIKQMGWHGGLNEDPEKPQAGVYFNCTDASKMGWFLNMDTQMGERVKNEDGSYTYPITVTFSNIITPEEKADAQGYILGRAGGGINGSAYFFAPAGGTVSDFVASNGVWIATDTYHDLQLGFMDSFITYAGKPVTVTYNVTTAPGVEAQLEFSKTPTVQAYH